MKTNFKTPSYWNGIDAMVFELAISSTLPNEEIKVEVIGDVYKTKTSMGNFTLTVELFKNSKLISTWKYDTDEQREMSCRFEKREY